MYKHFFNHLSSHARRSDNLCCGHLRSCHASCRVWEGLLRACVCCLTHSTCGDHDVITGLGSGWGVRFRGLAVRWCHVANPQLVYMYACACVVVCFTTIPPQRWPWTLLSWLCTVAHCLCFVVSRSPRILALRHQTPTRPYTHTLADTHRHPHMYAPSV